MTLPPPDVCYRALRAKESRFDGRLFVGVTSTGIYCRPICPARTPKAENCRFFPSAAAAEGAGFRPCLRCRPETSPDAAAWRGTSNTVSRALALIAAGGLDGDAGVTDLAARLGLGERHLRRLFDRHLGASPVAVAQTQRLLFAKQLLQDNAMTMAEVAQGAGFGSVRRFNDMFRNRYGLTPRSFRGRCGGSAVHVRLGFRPPFDWPALRDFLAARTVAGLEAVEPNRYVRVVALDGRHGSVTVVPGDHQIDAFIRFPDLRMLFVIVSRLRRMFDLDADPAAIGAQLSRDAAMKPLVDARPGLRVPGCWDAFEQAVRALLGQQVSIAAARILAGRLVERLGPKLSPDATGDARLTRSFPDPARIAAADLSDFGMPKARIAALQGLARAVCADPGLLERADAAQRLAALPGFGPWTVQYWAMRSLRDADAFPAADAGLLRSPLWKTRPTAKTLEMRAEGWRPWRAYAAQYLWTDQGDRP